VEEYEVGNKFIDGNRPRAIYALFNAQFRRMAVSC
jgi:hypothetical protein